MSSAKLAAILSRGDELNTTTSGMSDLQPLYDSCIISLQCWYDIGIGANIVIWNEIPDVREISLAFSTELIGYPQWSRGVMQDNLFHIKNMTYQDWSRSLMYHTFWLDHFALWGKPAYYRTLLCYVVMVVLLFLLLSLLMVMMTIWWLWCFYRFLITPSDVNQNGHVCKISNFIVPIPWTKLDYKVPAIKPIQKECASFIAIKKDINININNTSSSSSSSSSSS